MSLIFTRPVVGTTPSDNLTHRSKIPAVNTSSMYKTEMDLGVVRPHAQHAFRLVHLDSIPASSHENPPAVCVISPTDSAADAVELSISSPSEGNHNESEVKVETESAGKISDLITRFNGAESRDLDIKIPAKKFRIDLQNVHTNYDTASEDTNGSHPVQGDVLPLMLGSESSRLPVVQMKFKLHTQIANPKDVIVDSNIPERHKQLRVLKIPPTPAPKPVLMKNCGLPTAATCPSNTVLMKNCGLPTAATCPSNTVLMKNCGLPTAATCPSNTVLLKNYGLPTAATCPSNTVLMKNCGLPTAATCPSNTVLMKNCGLPTAATCPSNTVLMKNCGLPTAATCPSNTVLMKDYGLPTATTCPSNTVLMKNCGLPTAATCPSNTEPSDIHCVRPSEVRKVFPFAHIDFPRTDKSGVVSKTREYENGRNTYFQSGVSARHCNQSEHKLIQSQHRDAADDTDMLLQGISEERTIYNEDERSSTFNPQEEVVKESVTFSVEEKLQKAIAMEERLAVSVVKNKQQAALMKESLTVSLEEKQKNAVAMKPAILPRHIGINIHMPDNNKKMVTKDVTPVSVVTLDSGHDSGYATVNNEMGDVAISNQAGNISESGDSKHVNMIGDSKHVNMTGDSKHVNMTGDSKHVNITDTYRLVFGCVDHQTTCTDFSVGCCTTSTDSNVGYCTADTDTTACDTSVDTNVVGCPTSTNPNVRCCTTSTDSGVHGCVTSTDASIDVCPSSTECSIDGYPTSSEPIVDGCKISTEPSARGFIPSTDSTLSEYPTSSDHTVSECPISSDSTFSECTASTDSTVSACTTWRHSSVAGHSQKGQNADGSTISAKLDMLKAELMAMRKMDLVLLRQLINISQAIQRIQRSDLPKMSRSLTILSSRKTLQPRFKPVERQNSAPHCADRRRFLFSNARWRTEDDYRDSLSSFDESSFDSQSELEESSSSLNNTLSSPRSFDCPRILFQSCNIPLSLDISEEVDQSYEDILSRNVRLWKMGFQRHQSVQEKVDVWF